MNKLDEVAAVLDALKTAADGGELDRAVLSATKSTEAI